MELKSGAKTLTLKQFEEKYDEELEKLACGMFHSNVRALSAKVEGGASPELVDAMRWLDINVNVNWPLAHYKSAVRYLHKDPVDIAATGGTNWQKYLPPRFQKRIFFPELWSEKELENGAKAGWRRKSLDGDESNAQRVGMGRGHRPRVGGWRGRVGATASAACFRRPRNLSP